MFRGKEPEIGKDTEKFEKSAAAVKEAVINIIIYNMIYDMWWWYNNILVVGLIYIIIRI